MSRALTRWHRGGYASSTPGEIELYESEDGSITLDARADGENVWLTQAQMAELFGVDVRTVNEHLINLYEEDELERDATIRDFRIVRREGIPEVARSIQHYNLDAILSVGYPVRPRTATQFRRWSNEVLKRYLVDGVAENRRRLEEIRSVAEILGRSDDDQIAGIADVLRRYAGDLQLLDAYDHGTLAEPAGTPTVWELGYDDARQSIEAAAAHFPNDTMFGVERGQGLRPVLGQVHQTFGGSRAHLGQHPPRDHAHGRDERPAGEGPDGRARAQRARTVSVIAGCNDPISENAYAM